MRTLYKCGFELNVQTEMTCPTALTHNNVNQSIYVMHVSNGQVTCDGYD